MYEHATKTRPDPFGFDPTHVVDMRVEMASDNDGLPAEWPCEIVRRAAKLMKERAEAATPGPWRTHDTHLNVGGHTATVLSGEGNEVALRAWLPTWSHEPWDGTHNAWNNAYHVASLDPAVAELIAESWGHQADDMADHLAHLHPTTPLHGGAPGWFVADENERVHEDWTATLRAALAYLREDAPAVSA